MERRPNYAMSGEQRPELVHAPWHRVGEGSEQAAC